MPQTSRAILGLVRVLLLPILLFFSFFLSFCFVCLTLVACTDRINDSGGFCPSPLKRKKATEPKTPPCDTSNITKDLEDLSPAKEPTEKIEELSEEDKIRSIWNRYAVTDAPNQKDWDSESDASDFEVENFNCGEFTPVAATGPKTASSLTTPSSSVALPKPSSIALTPLSSNPSISAAAALSKALAEPSDPSQKWATRFSSKTSKPAPSSSSDDERSSFSSFSSKEPIAHFDPRCTSLTVPVSPPLQTSQRALLRPSASTPSISESFSSFASSLLQSDTTSDCTPTRRPIAEILQLTEPQDIHLLTEERSHRRACNCCANQTQHELKHFTTDRIDLSDPAQRALLIERLTMPKDIHLATEDRIQLRREQRQARGLDLPYSENDQTPQREYSDPHLLTTPQDISLMTEERARQRIEMLRSSGSFSDTSMSMRALQDECEIAKQFHANPIDYRIFDSNGELGLRMVEPLPLTTPQDVHLHTEARAQLRRELRLRQEENGEFSSITGSKRLREGFDSGYESDSSDARSSRRRSFQRTSILFDDNQDEMWNQAKRRRLSLTTPQSPTLLTKERAMIRMEHRDIFLTGDRFQGGIFNFKARPMPDFSEYHMSNAVEPLPLTQPDPFHLLTEERALQRSILFPSRPSSFSAFLDDHPTGSDRVVQTEQIPEEDEKTEEVAPKETRSLASSVVSGARVPSAAIVPSGGLLSAVKPVFVVTQDRVQSTASAQPALPTSVLFGPKKSLSVFQTASITNGPAPQSENTSILLASSNSIFKTAEAPQTQLRASLANITNSISTSNASASTGLLNKAPSMGIFGPSKSLLNPEIDAKALVSKLSNPINGMLNNGSNNNENVPKAPSSIFLPRH